MDLCVAVTLLCMIVGSLICVAVTQPATDQPFPSPQCANAELLATCQANFSRALSSTPPDNKSEICKIQFTYLTCTEQAVCACKYPNDHFLMVQAYREMMRTAYTFRLNSCQTYNADYVIKPGVWCDQNKASTYKVSMNTTANPIVANLVSLCPGLGSCFNTRDNETEVALFNKDLNSFCRTSSSFIQCLENQTCECKLLDDPAISQVLQYEKGDDDSMCKILPEFKPKLPGITCGGVTDVCSLRQPGVKCEEELKANLQTAIGQEELICGHMATYIKCYESVVCQCGLYQRFGMYTAVTMMRYAFDIRQNCSRFTGVSIPTTNGFPCPDNKTVPADLKLIALNSSKEQFAVTEDGLCPGVAKCFSQFDQTGSAALNSKDLIGLCTAMSNEIVCLENVTCSCGTLGTRFADFLTQRRQAMNGFCNSVVPPPPMKDCFDQSICNGTQPVAVCDDALNRPPLEGMDPHKTTCLNFQERERCVKQISCGCGLVKDGSSSTALDIYKLLTENAKSYDTLACHVVTGFPMPQSGISCPGPGSVDEAKKKLVVSWKQSPGKVQLDKECPGLQACYDQSDVVYADSLYTFDPKRMCRNQLNSLKCEEKALCGCGQRETRLAAIQKAILDHNANCSRYAPHVNMSACDESTMCGQALVTDVCKEKLTNQEDSVAQCYEWASYLNCAHDVTCTCGLLESGNETRSDAVYINIARINFLLFSAPKCSAVLSDIALRVPEMLMSPDFLCFDRATAVPKLIPVAKTQIAKAIEFDPWPSTCPPVLQCATQYDQLKIDALSKKDYMAYCVTSTNLIQCTRTALCACGLSTGPEAMALDTFLLSKYGDCGTVITLGSAECGHIGEGGVIVPGALPVNPPANNLPVDAPTTSTHRPGSFSERTTTTATVRSFVFGRNGGSERGGPMVGLISTLVVTLMSYISIVV